MRACIDTVTAADALTAVRLNTGIYVHLARLSAGLAVDALRLIQMHAVERDLIEESVDGAQRADVFTKRPVDYQACHKDQPQDYKFPGKETSELRRYLLVGCSEPDTCYGA